MTGSMSSLAERPDCIHEVAEIYFLEWGWHFADEWAKPDAASIESDLRENYTHDTFVLTHTDAHGNTELIGTVALLPEDLKGCPRTPWLTCLYVRPEYRRRGYGVQLMNHVLCSYKTLHGEAAKVYLWCYEEASRDWYLRNGWSVVEETDYRGEALAYVLCK